MGNLTHFMPMFPFIFIFCSTLKELIITDYWKASKWRWTLFGHGLMKLFHKVFTKIIETNKQKNENNYSITRSTLVHATLGWVFFVRFYYFCSFLSIFTYHIVEKSNVFPKEYLLYQITYLLKVILWYPKL